MKLENLIWFEKYRPKQIADMSMSVSHKKAFDEYVASKNVPHILLAGVQGSGKTTIAQILLKQIPCHKLVLNASGKDRGIDTIKGPVVQFASSMPEKGKINIVFLDEADALTGEAQNALKNTMETYSSNTRFILTCNNIDKIVPPIQSRCIKYSFDQLPKKKLVRLLQHILKSENIEDVPEPELEKLISKFYPDIRSAVNNLQAACLTGIFDPKAMGALQVDPAKIGAWIKEGKLFSIRQYISGTMDFSFLYKWLFDVFIMEVPEENRPEAAKDIATFAALDRTVPDREMQMASCCITLMLSCGSKISFTE